MGLLDSLNPINLAKNAVESIADSVLPDGLKSVGHDLVDAAVDMMSGNYGGLANDVSSFLHDAETAMGSLTNLGAAFPSLPATEPDAPPTSTPAASTKSAGTTSAGTKSAGSAAADSKASDTKSSSTKTTTPASTTKSESKSDSKTTGETAPTTTPIGTTGTTDTPSTDKTTDKTTSTTDSKSTSKSSSSSSSTTTGSTSSSDAKDITKFFAQSDTDLMASVRDGKLPDAVKDDPAAMQRLQLRMNEISEMNQLISQMLAAMHDMNKAVIQNIRA